MRHMLIILRPKALGVPDVNNKCPFLRNGLPKVNLKDLMPSYEEVTLSRYYSPVTPAE